VAPLAGAISPPASPLASRIAAEHRLDLSRVQPSGKRIQKADVLTYLQQQNNQGQQGQPPAGDHHPGRTPASPKARRLALEYGVNLAAIKGSGPDGAVLAADVQSSRPVQAVAAPELARPSPAKAAQAVEPIAQGGATTAGMEEPAATGEEAVGTIWRVMAERTTQSWMGTPHFYLVREVDAGRLIAWREQVKQRAEGAGGAGGAETKITYTDLLVKVVAAALRRHARVNASWREGKIVLHDEVHIGLAVAIEQGLVVPVIHQADRLNLREIAARRQEAVALAQAGKLRPADLQGGTFTISNLGMYGVDAFNAIINQPQAAILAVGRIAERVVPLHGQPSVQPMMVLTLSCDHRAIDGARGAQFLATVAELVEEPLGLLD
jgi:pyruvate dehydrogenase E2 component (dihydrolipoamide acetyltransferase)